MQTEATEWEWAQLQMWVCMVVCVLSVSFWLIHEGKRGVVGFDKGKQEMNQYSLLRVARTVNRLFSTSAHLWLFDPFPGVVSHLG